MKKKTLQTQKRTSIYFTDFFGVSQETLAEYGAFNVSPTVDLPLFIDPFLLFTSSKPEYQALHEDIVRYLRFLRDKSLQGQINRGLLKAWYCFHEVSQNRLGFCLNGNDGAGLGMKFATALNENLSHIFKDFGSEQVTQSSHLEKLVLIKERVGRDNISDFTTNLIKGFLLRYTENFAKQHVAQEKRKLVKIDRVQFNYQAGVWLDGEFDLPWFVDDYVLLTPEDILTKDDIWINKEDLRKDFPRIREAVENDALRSQIEAYFLKVLPEDYDSKEEKEAIEKTLRRFPSLIDHYIRDKEKRGDEAVRRSKEKVTEAESRFIQNLGHLAELVARFSSFYETPSSTLEETKRKIGYLKQVIENQDGYRLFYVKGKQVEREKDLQILFKLVWEGSPSSADAEVNNGRGPVDFKISRGAHDTTLVEFKLASNSQIERNLEKQVEIYKKANQTTQSYKVVVFFTAREGENIKRIIQRLKIPDAAGIILIDARSDNKPSASKA
jgi:hypothetical protein